MRLPDIRTTRVKKLNIDGLPKVSIIPWSNEQMIQYTQALEDLEELDRNIKVPKILSLQYEMLVKQNILDSADKEFTMLQKQLLMVELYKVSRGVRLELRYPCNNDECDHYTKGYFNLNDNVHYRAIKESKKVINGYEFRLTNENFVEVYSDDQTSKVKYLLGYIGSVYKDGIKFEFTSDELYKWVMEELPDAMFGDLLIYLESNIPNVTMVQKLKCEKCKEENVYTFEGIPDFSLGLLE